MYLFNIAEIYGHPPLTYYTMLYMCLFTPHPVHVSSNFVSMFVRTTLHASNVHVQSTGILFKMFIFMDHQKSYL